MRSRWFTEKKENLNRKKESFKVTIFPTFGCEDLAHVLKILYINPTLLKRIHLFNLIWGLCQYVRVKMLMWCDETSVEEGFLNLIGHILKKVEKEQRSFSELIFKTISLIREAGYKKRGFQTEFVQITFHYPQASFYTPLKRSSEETKTQFKFLHKSTIPKTIYFSLKTCDDSGN